MKITRSLLILPLFVSSFLVANGSSSLQDRDCPVLCPVNPINPKDYCCHNLHIDLGLLYQQPYIPEMIAGIEYEQIEDIEGDIDYETDRTDYLEECFDYALGFTASLGYLMDHDEWYLGSKFDYLCAQTSHSYDTTDQVTIELYPYEQYLGTEDTGDHAIALQEIAGHGAFSKIAYRSTIDTYVLDIFLSRGSFHSNWFSYTPFLGVKAIWFSTAQLPKYYDTEAYAEEFTKQNNWGCGPMFGFDAEFHFLENIALFSNSDIALLVGEANKSISALYQTLNPTLSAQDKSIINQNIDCIVYVPLRSIIGVKLSKYCFDDKHYFALKIGFDVRVVIALNEIDRGYTMNGLFANIIWNF